MVLKGYPHWPLWIAATTGNTLGAVLNWLLGKYLLHFQNRRWFPFKPAKLIKAQAVFNRWGMISLLFAWLPIVGDPLTFLAGTLRCRFIPFLLLVAIGKGLRYWVVIITFQ
jgi:membrane protein YqaA with SNARE-associated domain